MSTEGQGPGKPDPKDATEEVENAIDLIGDLLTGRRTPKSVVVELLEKVFPDKPKTEEKPEATKANLRVVDGSR